MARSGPPVRQFANSPRPWARNARGRIPLEAGEKGALGEGEGAPTGASQSESEGDLGSLQHACKGSRMTNALSDSGNCSANSPHSLLPDAQRQHRRTSYRRRCPWRSLVTLAAVLGTQRSTTTTFYSTAHGWPGCVDTVQGPQVLKACVTGLPGRNKWAEQRMRKHQRECRSQG